MATRIAPREQPRHSLFRMKNAGPDEVTLPSDGVLIGRDPAACDAVLDADDAPRRRARIMTDTGGEALLTDLGSTNCSAMPTQSKFDETVVPNADACGACGAAARCRGAFCHRCGARLTGR